MDLTATSPRSDGSTRGRDDGADLATLVRIHPWQATPLGPIEGWPSCLLLAADIVLASPAPLVLLWGHEGVMIYNDAYAVIAGSRHPEILGMRVEDAWPEIADFNRRNVAVGLGGGTLSFRDEELSLDRDGSLQPAWFDLDYSPVRDESGRPVGVLAVLTETTSKVLAQRGLRDSERRLAAGEARLRLVTDALPVLISYVDSTHCYRFVNRTYEQWFGLQREEIVGRHAREVIGEAAYQTMRPLIDAALGGRGVSLETFVHYKHGGPRHIRIDYVPDQRADGTVDGYNALVQDISERKLAEEEMRVASRRNEALAAEQAAILGQLAEGVIVTDPAGRITFVNDAAERLHGVARLDVPPQDYSDTYHLLTEEGQPYPPEELPLARAVLRDETVTEARWRIARPDGTEVIAVGSARPVLAPDGAKLGAVLTLRDDTARASAEKALLGLNARLEAEVAERTADRDRMWRSSQDLFVVLGGDGVFRAINPAWTAVLGYDADQVVGQRFDRFVHPDDVERTFAVVARATGGLIRQFENRYRHRDGSYRWIAWTAEPHEGLIYGVGRDVTADKEQALALQQAE